MYQLVTCVTASCDLCGADAETDDGIAHYYSQTGAETAGTTSSQPPPKEEQS